VKYKSVRLFQDLWRQRVILFQLAVYDFRHEYLGTWFGFVWAFIHPLLSAIILWFVFSHGFRGKEGESYFLWLVSGLFPWQFVSLSMRGGTMSVIQHSFLVRKLAFRVEFLPFVKILSASFLHGAFVLILLVLAALSGFPPRLHALQILYYYFAATMLALGFAWVSSAVTVFVKDFAGVVEVLLQISFLATPIFWRPEILPEAWRPLIKLNPIYYIVSGYRESLLGSGWFFDRPIDALGFWILSGLLLVTGVLVFRRLRPVFADYI